jgi:hypothetical protein
MILGDEFEPECVESAHPHFDRGVRIADGQPLAHFFGGLVGKGEGKDRGGRGSVIQQVLDAMDERARLSGARPGIDQERAAAPGRGFKLAGIQRVAWAGTGGRRSL